jgi:hypothetical protein
MFHVMFLTCLHSIDVMFNNVFSRCIFNYSHSIHEMFYRAATVVVFLTWVMLPLCMGEAWVWGFSQPVWEGLFHKGLKRFYPCFKAKWWFYPRFLTLWFYPYDFKKKGDSTLGPWSISNGVNFWTTTLPMHFYPCFTFIFVFLPLFWISKLTFCIQIFLKNSIAFQLTFHINGI